MKAKSQCKKHNISMNIIDLPGWYICCGGAAGGLLVSSNNCGPPPALPPLFLRPGQRITRTS